MLNQDIFSDINKMQELLRQPVVVIDNALESDIAENLYQQLIQANSWEQQGTDTIESSEYSRDFKFKRKSIDMQDPAAPPAVTAMYEYINSEEIRQMFSEICGRQCDSFRAAATIFNKGDHISDHNDLYIYDEKPRYKRILTFNYYLTKNWDVEWGGNLVWKKPHQVITPKFNSLVLFNVTQNSHHWVEPVLKNTDNKRLSITGWFLQEMKKEKFKLSI